MERTTVDNVPCTAVPDRLPFVGLLLRALMAVLAGLLVPLAACRHPGGGRGTTPIAGARAEDAAQLPAFTNDSPAAGEIERFIVELGDAPTRGPADAPVTVVMFSDFECPYCREGYLNLRQLEREYAGRVRIAYKAFPLDLHSQALPAAIAARTAQAQGKFWEFHDRLYDAQDVDVDRLFAIMRDVGVDPKVLQRDFDTLEFGPEVRRDMRQARRLGVSSTPTFFINGRVISGAQPLAEMAGVVDNELERAEAWLAEGTPSDRLYARAMEGGYRSVVYRGGRRGLDPDAVMVVPIGDSPTRGPATAPVTIVEFADFECPFCSRGHSTIERLRERYGDRLRVVHKHSPLPFHSHALMAARASMAAAAQGKFWQYHDELYRTQADFNEETLIAIAKRLRIDMKKFRDGMESSKFDKAIDADVSLAASLGVTGTPAYFVNGRPVEGALPELHFRLLIEEELERAAAATASGTPPDQLYDVLTHQPLAD